MVEVSNNLVIYAGMVNCYGVTLLRLLPLIVMF